MFALLDGNNFYASCEVVFNAALRGRPLVVLSNNDGCAIARSAEAKALGVGMGQPIHEIPREVRRQLVVRSANFTLYGDISARIVSILRDAAPRIETYSIDEQFICTRGIKKRMEFARALRERVHRWTGIPNCIGLGPTKVIAKGANRIAKRGAGVVDLTDASARVAALQDFPVEDVWGIGARTAAKLAARGILTAAQLRDAPPADILAAFGVTIARVQRELQGHSCIALEEIEPDRKQIVVSRSFGRRVEDHDAVAQALATFAVRACEKLRRRGLATCGVGIFANSDVFRPELPQHHPSRTVNLPRPTGDSRVVLAMVRSLLRGFLRHGIPYKKAGVMLHDLARPERLQGDLFGGAMLGDPGLMRVVDRINGRYGRGTAGFGATGWRDSPAWGMRQQRLSPCYTTRFADLPLARC